VTTHSGAGASDTELSLSLLLKRAIVDAHDKALGQLEDAIVRLREDDYPLLTGLVIRAGANRIFVSIGDVVSIEPGSVRLRTAKLDLRPFERRDGEVLLKRDVLGHRLIDVAHSALVKAYDVRLKATEGGWTAIGLDVHKQSWFHFGAHEHHHARDWHGFVLLLGDQKSFKIPPSSRWMGRLKPAQIADIIEAASAQEQDLLLAQVHEDPALEAHVFGELDDERQARLLKNRSDQDVADVLSRMRADDVADAVMELPQDRRLKVLELLPQPQNTKVLTLLGYNHATAGGLMGTDYLALSEDHSIADALQKLRTATTQQPEALTTIHSLGADGALAGTISLVRALQLDPATPLREAADPHPIAASPQDDIIAVTTRMADFNLLTLPVVDHEGRILGIITVDDALEAAIPNDWSRREPGHPTPLLRHVDGRKEA
jgi:CBS domain-containing protein